MVAVHAVNPHQQWHDAQRACLPAWATVRNWVLAAAVAVDCNIALLLAVDLMRSLQSLPEKARSHKQVPLASATPPPLHVIMLL